MTLPVTAALAELLDPYADADPDTPFVCLMHPWATIQDRNLRQSFNRVRRKLGITRNLRPHDLRRTTAVNVLNITKDLRIVQAVLGHKDLQSTLHYLDHRNTVVDPATLELAKLPPTTETIQ